MFMIILVSVSAKSAMPIEISKINKTKQKKQQQKKHIKVVNALEIAKQ